MTGLLAVPNVSEGSRRDRIEMLANAFCHGAILLDSHSDPLHGRSVFTLASSAPGPSHASGSPGAQAGAAGWRAESGAGAGVGAAEGGKIAAGGEGLLGALRSGAAAAIAAIDMSAYAGAHPAVGALDVCPIVWLRPEARAAATELALAAAAAIGELGIPAFLYGALARSPDRSERAFFRNGGLAELWLRMEAGELRPDQGPSLPHPRAGVTLVTARPPLAAFNVEIDSDEVEVARAVAAGLREAGGGLPGVRAIGLSLPGGRGQVSTNVHDPLAVPLGEVVERVRALAAPLGAEPLEAELVGLVPESALAGYPESVPIRGFERVRHTIEGRLSSLDGVPKDA